MTTIILLVHLLGAAVQPAPALRIVVLEGEDAVNVIQQKTAVAPVVEVRDRNNVPVAGASVTFTIGGNAASFAGGVQTITVATNAAGQAAAAAINPLASGAVQIQVAAAFQGQTAAATIVQTNVLTAAQAAGAAGASSGSAGGGTSTAAGGGAAGGGGGISATTIGIAAAAVGGGALAANQLIGGGGNTTYSGSYSMLVPLTFSGCTRSELWTGTLRITLESTEPLTGSAEIEGQSRVEAVTCTGGPQAGAISPNEGMPSTPVTGTASNLGFTSERSNSFPPEPGAQLGGTNTVGFSFSGTLNGAEITGTLTHTRRIQNNAGGAPGTGTASTAVTLR
jgi:hypothetical protein